MTLFIVSFIAGILTVLAPCVLPLLPVTLGGAVAEAGNRKRPLVIIGALAVSVFVFTLLLKGSTALIGATPTFWAYISALILIAFGLTLLFPIAWAQLMLKLPGHNKPEFWMARGYQSRGHWWADILVGAALGPVFTTCSPTFFVILATVLPQSFSMGIIDLLAYIIGLSISLLLVAYVGQKLVNRLEWATDPNGWFRKTLGVLFIVIAVAIVFGWDKKVESAILNAGFFDVTTLEQSIHQSLEGPTSLPSAPTGALNATSTANVPAGTTSVGVNSTLPPPPAERNEGKYIELAKPAGFVNSAPFKLADLVGKKVILVDFIDYSCINCERTFPYMNDWYSKYKDQGLEIVAFHTPEFSFEKDVKNVTAAAKMFKLMFPIVLDNDYATWNAYQNEYWPHKYLINIHGQVVYDHIGEGAYDETESEIVHLLNERKQFLGESGVVNVAGTPMPDYTIQTQSPETYFGAMRNESFGNGTPYLTGTGSYTIPANLSPNTFYLGGKWDIQREYAETAEAGAQVSYLFKANKVYIVAATADGSPADATIQIDGKPIPAGVSGADVKDGTLTIDMSRLYGLFAQPTPEPHRIDIIFKKVGARIFTFTFG